MTYLQKVKKEKNLSVTAILPVLNEEATVKTVIEIVESHPLIDEIIIIEDGSSDNSLPVVKKLRDKYAKVKLIINKENEGKASSVIKAANKSTSEILLMLDADLKGITHQHIDLLLTPLLEETYPMSILMIGSNKLFFSGSFGLALIFSGQRAIHRKDVLDCNLDPDTRYCIEADLNEYLRKKGERAISFVGYGISDRPTTSMQIPASIFQKIGPRNLYEQNCWVERVQQKLFENLIVGDLSKLSHARRKTYTKKNSIFGRIFYTIYGQACIILKNFRKQTKSLR